MKFLILSSFILAISFIIIHGTSPIDRSLDYSFQELETSNDKLTEINIQRHKIKDFIKRWGYFYGYVVPEI